MNRPSWKGRIIGAIIGLFFGGVGAIVGLCLGYYFYDKPRNEILQRQLQAQNAFTGNNISPIARERLIKTTFRLMGYVSRGAGRVNEAHINQAQHIMELMELSAPMRRLAIESFNLGKSDYFDIQREAQKLIYIFGQNDTILSFLIEIQVAIAIADNNLEHGEHERLHHIAAVFGISEAYMEQLIRVRVAEMQFSNFSQQYTRQQQSSHGGEYNTYNNSSYEEYERYGYDEQQKSESYSNDNSYSNESYANNYKSDLENAYEILGVSKDASWEEVRRAHKKLMLKYHPDRLASQGLPPEMITMYTKKAQDVQAAFALIKRYLGKK